MAPVELKFGGVAVESPHINSIICAFIVGVVCGLLGAVFVMVNAQLAKIRKKHITKGWQKVLEAVLFAFATSSCFYWAPQIYGTCKDDSLISEENKELLLRYDCSEG